MSSQVAPRRPEEFTRFEVIRWVDSGAEEFCNQTRALSAEILGIIPSGAIEVSGNPHFLNFGDELCRVYPADDLRLEMYTRREPPEGRPENRYRSLKENLEKDVNPKRRNDLDRPNDEPKLSEVMERIQQIDHGLLDQFVDVDLVSLADRFASDVRNGHYEITLLPDLTSKAGKMLLDQSRYIQSRVAGESRKVAYSSGSDRLEVPVASMGKIYEFNGREKKFIDAVRSLLPIRVRLQNYTMR